MSPLSHDFITACALLHTLHNSTEHFGKFCLYFVVFMFLIYVSEVLCVKPRWWMDKLTNHEATMALIMCVKVLSSTLAKVWECSSCLRFLLGSPPIKKKASQPQESDGISWHGNVLSIQSQVSKQLLPNQYRLTFLTTIQTMQKKHYRLMLMCKLTPMYSNVLYTTGTFRLGQHKDSKNKHQTECTLCKGINM